jgi:hypothetical protein
MPNIYYVYVHKCPDTLLIRYIGKGKGKRAYDLHDRSAHHKNWIKSLEKKRKKPIVEIWENGLPEDVALEQEVYWIKFLKSFGFLTNMTNGGEGTSGFSPSIETRKKMSLAQKGRKKHPSSIEKTRQANIGKTCSDEKKKKISDSHKGKIVPQSVREKMSKGHTGVPRSEATRKKISDGQAKRSIIDNNGVVYSSIAEASRVLQIPARAFYRVLIGERKTVHGMSFKYMDMNND